MAEQSFRATHTAGGCAQVLNFRNADEHGEWCGEVMAVKDCIAHINQHVWHPEPRLSSCWDDWLLMVHAFSQKWGAHRVPKDIDRLRKEVEVGVQAAT